MPGVAVLKTLREKIKRMPVIGQPIYRLYMTLRYGDGKVFVIESGPLKGTKMHRFVRTFFPSQKSGDYEQEVQTALLRELMPGHTLFDVGANGGFFSLLGAQIVGSEGRIFAFEAHPETARQCRQQLKLNRLANTTVVEAAVCDRSGSMTFSDGSNSFNRRLVDRSGEGPVITVNAITLDEAAAQYGVPDVIKMDIEGAELRALQGAQRLLRQRRPTLILEIHSRELVQQILPMLQECGYELQDLTLEDADHVRKYVARAATPASGWKPPPSEVPAAADLVPDGQRL